MASHDLLPCPVHEYVESYEFRFDDGGGYTPNDNERAMLEDAINGYLAEQEQNTRAAETELRTTIPGLKSGHQKITPACRANRGIGVAFLEAADRLRNQYEDYAPAPDNSNVTWHLVLVREESAA